MQTAREFADALAALLHREHDALAEFLVALADFDERRVWMELGHGSLFSFLVRDLKLSKAGAQYRKVAAELIRDVPAVAGALRDGKLCLNSIIEVAKVLTAENCDSVLPRFYGLSRREAEVIVAELQPHPKPPVRTVMTLVRPPVTAALPTPTVDLASAPTPAERGEAATNYEMGSGSRSVSSSHEPARSPGRDVAPEPPRAELVPLTADLRRLGVTVSKAFAAKLEQARHARPDLTTDQILEAGLDLLLEKSAKAKGLVERPQKTVRPSKRADHIAAQVKREVMQRSGGRCEYRLADGEVCGSTHALQFHHVTARAKGGTARRADEVMLTCREHNVLFAREDFGHQVMDRYTGRARSQRSAHATAPARGFPRVPPPQQRDAAPRAPDDATEDEDGREREQLART